MRPVIFRSTKFCQGFETSKTLSSCLGAGQIFFRREIWQIRQFTRHDLEEKVNQENFISIFSQSHFQSEAHRNYFLGARQSTVKMADSYLGMLHNDPYSEYNYYGSQVYVPAASPGPSTVQFISAKVVDSALFWSLLFYVSHRWRLLYLVDPKILRTLWRGCSCLMWLTRVVTNIFLCLSAPTLDKLKIWQRQIFSRFLVGPDKFCQSSAFGPKSF